MRQGASGMAVVQPITREQLREHLDRGDITVIEALGPEHHEQAHLPGALNLPHDQVDQLAPQLLSDLDQPVAVYCADLACPNSAIAAERLVELGYTRVFQYAEGKKGWVEAGLPIETGPAAAHVS